MLLNVYQFNNYSYCNTSTKPKCNQCAISCTLIQNTLYEYQIKTKLKIWSIAHQFDDCLYRNVESKYNWNPIQSNVNVGVQRIWNTLRKISENVVKSGQDWERNYGWYNAPMGWRGRVRVCTTEGGKFRWTKSNEPANLASWRHGWIDPLYMHAVLQDAGDSVIMWCNVFIFAHHGPLTKYKCWKYLMKGCYSQGWWWSFFWD